MTNPADPNRKAKPEPRPSFWLSAWNWLTRPLSLRLTPSGRRTHLLAWLLVFILLLTTATLILVLIVNPPTSPRRSEYVGLILGLNVFIGLAYGLNCAGRYSLAAGLVVACAILGPWGSLILDPTILRGDFVPLAYTMLSVLLASILLSPFITVFLAGFQLIALALIPFVSPATASINWPSLLALIFFISVLSILSNSVSRGDLEQIDQQTRQLSESEALLRELSVRDHLTGLFNRRYLEETLEREIRRSSRSPYTIGVILFDVDHFKAVNDRWGHAAGDLILQQIGQLALAHIRGGDIACRLGGDEFVLILPEASQEVTLERAEQLRTAVRQLQLEYNGQPLGTITISSGVALFPGHGPTSQAILKLADQALYQAKSEGRNRVRVAD